MGLSIFVLGKSDPIIDLFKDKDVIAINQQYAGHAGDFVKELVPSLTTTYPSTGIELWAKPLPHAKIAVAVFNRGSAVGPVSFSMADLPGLGSSAVVCAVQDVWTKQIYKHANITYTITQSRERSVDLLVFSNCSTSFIV